MRLATIFTVLVLMLLPGLGHAQLTNEGLLQSTEPEVGPEAVPAAPRTAAGSVFEVPKVPVSAEADNASAAQNIARDQGRRIAMDILLRRLTAEEDWIYLPRMVAGEAAPVIAGSEEPDAPRQTITYSAKQAVTFDPARLPAIEEGFSVFDEKSSARTYSAKITYRFKAEEVRNMLKNAHLPYSESQTRMALVIPVLTTESGTYLWETNNPWARAWLARSLTNELTPMLLPRGDETDMAMLPVEKALQFDQEALQEMADRYGVSQVLVAQANLDIEDEQYRMRARLQDGYLAHSGRSAATYDASTASAMYDDAGGFGTDGSAVRTAGEQPGRTLTEGFYRDKTGDFPALAQRAVENVVTRYSAGWKAQTLVDHSVVRQVRVNAWFDSLDDFARIRAALEASPIVEGIEVQAMAAEGGTITISVVGDIEQLVADLRQRGVIFWSVDNIVWNIATPEKAETVSDRIKPVDGRAFRNRVEGNPLGEGLDGQNPGERALDALGDFSPPSDREMQQRRLRDDTPSLNGGDAESGEGGDTQDDDD